MPNWVTNILKIGCNSKKLDEIKKNISSDKKAIDFDKIIPMPESLRVEDSSLGDLALHVLYYDMKSEFSDEDPYGEEDWGDTDKYKATWYTDDEAQKRWKELKDKEKATELAKRYKYNIDNYGSKTWYDWACKNWGTKWNASDSEFNGNIITFDTAWATPYPIIQRLSQMYPEVKFSVAFADEDIGNNCGKYVFMGGEEIFFEEGDENFALDVKGISKEEFDSWHD